MDNLASGTHKRFRESPRRGCGRSRPSRVIGRERYELLGPCFGADTRLLTELGPSVGDDGAGAPSVTLLGPSVGDDEVVSDVRLKEDVQRVGTTVFGLPLYHFRYLGKPETYEGVMAHEVLQVMPDAVSVASDGYYRVNYSALGTSTRRMS